VIVKEAIMIEPTETESKATMDAFNRGVIEAARQAEADLIPLQPCRLPCRIRGLMKPGQPGARPSAASGSRVVAVSKEKADRNNFRSAFFCLETAFISTKDTKFHEDLKNTGNKDFTQMLISGLL